MSTNDKTYNHTYICHGSNESVTNITDWFFKIRKVPNCKLVGLLDMCRTNIDLKSPVKYGPPEYGQSYIGFAVLPNGAAAAGKSG